MLFKGALSSNIRMDKGALDNNTTQAVRDEDN